jgi:hypothetical protein
MGSAYSARSPMSAPLRLSVPCELYAAALEDLGRRVWRMSGDRF